MTKWSHWGCVPSRPGRADLTLGILESDRGPEGVPRCFPEVSGSLFWSHFESSGAPSEVFLEAIGLLKRPEEGSERDSRVMFRKFLRILTKCFGKIGHSNRRSLSPTKTRTHSQHAQCMVHKYFESINTPITNNTEPCKVVQRSLATFPVLFSGSAHVAAGQSNPPTPSGVRRRAGRTRGGRSKAGG